MLDESVSDSPSEQIVVPDAPSEPVEDVKQDESSPSENIEDVKKEEPQTLLDKVKETLSQKPDIVAEPASSPDENTDKVDVDPESKESNTEVKEDADIPKEFGKHPAWQRILKERNESRDLASSYKEKADKYEGVETFLSTNGVSATDAAEALKLTALIYNNPTEAYKKLKTFVDRLAVTTGAELPEDLAVEVDKGYISEGRAAELAKARADASLAQNRLAATEAERQRQYQAEIVNQRDNTVSTWLEQVTKTDPDFQIKSPMVQAEVHRIVAVEGRPNSPQEMSVVLSRAYTSVNEHIKKIRPQRQAINPSPKSSGVSSTASTAPNSMLDITRRVLAGSVKN